MYGNKISANKFLNSFENPKVYGDSAFFVMCVFFYFTAFAVSGKVGNRQTSLTTPVWWLSLLQLTVLSRSAIVV